MTWTMLDNTNMGACKVQQSYHSFAKVSMGQVLYAAIDEFGRLFTWGDGGGNTNNGHHGQEVSGSGGNTFFPDPDTNIDGSLEQMEIPKQLGTAQNWVDVQTSESKITVLNDKGEIWVVGEHTRGTAGTAISNYTTGLFNYNEATDLFERDGTAGAFQIIDLTLVTNTAGVLVWDAVAAGWTHTLALSNGTAYIWGYNKDSTFGDTSVVADDAETSDAVEITWIPSTSDIKLIAADNKNNVVVTEANEVYAWGEFQGSVETTTPTLITGISIPVGETITDICVTNSGGIVALLSDGTIWANGFFARGSGDAGLPWQDNFLQVGVGRTYVDIDCNDFSAGALDTDGNLWGWGGFNNFLSRDEANCNLTSWDTLILVASSTEGNVSYESFSVGKNLTNAAIDVNGQLFTWGDNAQGALGIDVPVSETASSCPPVLASPALGWRGRDHNSFYPYLNLKGDIDLSKLSVTEARQLVFLNTIRAIGLSEYTAVEDELEPNHEPHWHKTLYPQPLPFPNDCWFPAIAIDGTQLLWVGQGWSHYNFVMVTFDLLGNVWTTVFLANPPNAWRTTLVPGGVAVKGSVYAYHNYKEEVSGFPRVNNAAGDPIQPTFSDPEMATWVVDRTSGTSIVWYTEWPSTLQMSGRGKVAVNGSGLVAVIVQTATFWTVEVSTDFGENWVTRKSVGYDADIIDSAVLIDSSDDIYIVRIDNNANTARIERSDDNGLSWDLQNQISIVANAELVDFRVDGSDYYMAIETSDGGVAKFYYSSNLGVTWTERTLNTTSRLFAASGTALYDLAAGQGADQRTLDYTDFTIEWVSIVEPEFETVSQMAYLVNSGLNTVYATPMAVVNAERQLFGGALVGMLVSDDLGLTWTTIETPFVFFSSEEAATIGLIDPTWELIPTAEPAKLS